VKPFVLLNLDLSLTRLGHIYIYYVRALKSFHLSFFLYLPLHPPPEPIESYQPPTLLIVSCHSTMSTSSTPDAGSIAGSQATGGVPALRSVVDDLVFIASKFAKEPKNPGRLDAAVATHMFLYDSQPMSDGLVVRFMEQCTVRCPSRSETWYVVN